jgi:hypothetical protein
LVKGLIAANVTVQKCASPAANWVMRTSKPHWINQLPVTFDSEVRKGGRAKNYANFAIEKLAIQNEKPQHSRAGARDAACVHPASDHQIGL